LNLGERIVAHQHEIKGKDLITLIDDAFFGPEQDRGVTFHVRRTNLFREKRTKHILDELEEREKMQHAKEEAEAKRIMTFDEFVDKFGDAIEGRAPKEVAGGRERGYSSTHSRPVTGGQDDDGKSDAGASDKRRSKANNSTISKGSKSGANSLSNTKEGFEVKDDIKYDLPDTCFMFLMKGCKISKMNKKFKLLSHPYPLVDGEMILFQPLKQDQYDKSLFVFRDYSLKKRMPTRGQGRKLTTYQQKQLEKEDEEISKLRALEIDISHPLSYIDWTNFAEVITEVQGLGWVQVLPVGEKASQPLQCQLMHILPNSKIPFSSLPLDVLISNKTAALKKRSEHGTGEEAKKELE